jgi:MinD superfamily P-loop ATPase
MKQLVILSGKGGTGKTSVAGGLAHLASQTHPLVLVDADVDAANLELILGAKVEQEHAFMGMDIACINEGKCSGCGICEGVCRFQAISPFSLGTKAIYRVDDLSCEGCAACLYQCPEEAIVIQPHQAGLWFRSQTRYGPFFHAHLFAGQPNSGKLVALIKSQAREVGLKSGKALMLVDGPPGIGCPVIATLSGADAALLVVEPTVSGVHDLERILGTAEHFGVPAGVVINKADINDRQRGRIEGFCEQEGIEIVGRIPFDPLVPKAMVEGVPMTEYGQGPVPEAMIQIWASIREQLLGTEVSLPILGE